MESQAKERSLKKSKLALKKRKIIGFKVFKKSKVAKKDLPANVTLVNKNNNNKFPSIFKTYFFIF